MSFYRKLMVCVAVFGLATNVLANTNSSNMEGTNDQTQSMSSSSEQMTKVNLNTATAKELTKVKGLNRAKSNNIVSYRKKHGDFKSLDDLKLVKGFKKMSPDKLKSIQDQLTID